MIDREKVLKGLEYCANGCSSDCPYWNNSFTNGDCIFHVQRDAIELLKEQKAVKPIITPWAENEDGEVVISKKECGRCGYQFFTEKPNYCENCGTPVLWESD